MNNAALLQKLAYGYAKSAQYIGALCNVYPGGVSTAPAISLAPILQTFAAFAVDPKFSTAWSDKTQYLRAYIDTAQVRPGMIVQSPEGVFVLVRAGLTPPVALVCPQALTFSRTQQQYTAADGLHPVSAVYLGAYPANVTLKRDKGFSEPVGMSSVAGQSNTSAPLPEFVALVPLLVPGVILAGDTATDPATGETWRVDACNFGALGYELALTPYTPTA